MDDRTVPVGAQDAGESGAGPTAHGATEGSAAEERPGSATPPRRGFPGFPDGDPDQLPLSRRPRGLDATPPPGGRDPEIRATLARERPYVRLLVGMVVLIVGGSLLLTFLALVSAAFLR